jgi:hypothetical protein
MNIETGVAPSEINRLYHESYQMCIKQLEGIRDVLNSHSKKQYMDPENSDYVRELIYFNSCLEDCVNQLKEEE